MTDSERIAELQITVTSLVGIVKRLVDRHGPIRDPELEDLVKTIDERIERLSVVVTPDWKHRSREHLNRITEPSIRRNRLMSKV